MTAAGSWVRVCPVDALTMERGAAALVDGIQIALFRLADGNVHAVQHRDPFSGANVLARGIVGSRQGEPTVASPMYKQVFSLRTGRCLDRAGREPVPGDDGNLVVHAVQVRHGAVHVGPAVSGPAVSGPEASGPAASGLPADDQVVVLT
ncbi:nitrite reductase small subunit NirD [Nakamurella sp. A5-74]|uniref:Nitrite reductase small subunit NirD n=1 Tax=Nakamurella sp. A5-74 TaxID=3158264 RepID=A0AAU8DUH0_9ACTN